MSRPVARTILVAHSGAELYGADRMLLESVAGLGEVGCRVVVALPVTGPLVAELRRVGAEVEIVPMLRLNGQLRHPSRWPGVALSALLGPARISRLIGRIDPDIVYISTSAIPQWPLAARRRGIRSISHLHEAPRSSSRWANHLRYLPHLASQRILVNSRFSLETMRQMLPALARRAEIVHNGITSPDSPALPREPLESPLRVLYMGPLSPHKGPDLGLEAATLLQEMGMDVQVTVLGASLDGSEWFTQQLSDQAADSGREVEFAGFQRNVWPYLARADVLVAPSRFDEPFGNAAVEAVLALRPVIASDTSGLREAVGGYPTTALVTPGDARAIADALAVVINTWSTLVQSLAASRQQAMRRHDTAAYRAAIVRACGAEGAGRRDHSGT